jgi:hypothetical protein
MTAAKTAAQIATAATLKVGAVVLGKVNGRKLVHKTAAWHSRMTRQLLPVPPADKRQPTGCSIWIRMGPRLNRQQQQQQQRRQAVGGQGKAAAKSGGASGTPALKS